MAINNPKDLFVRMLSSLRQHEEHMTGLLEELANAAGEPNIKEALESRIFLKTQILSTLDRCFKIIGEQPVKVSERLQDIFMEDFRKELAEIKSPAVRQLFVLAKAKHLMHLRVAEYVALTAMADLTRHYGVGVLLESCLAENMALVDRTRRLIRHIVEHEVGERLAA